MKITIERTFEIDTLTRLNKTGQDLHFRLHPTEYKKYNLDSIQKAFTEMIANENIYAFLAKNKTEALGYILCYKKTRSENEFQFAKSVLHIDQISVENQFQNLGIGTLLINKAIELANELEVKEIHLDHWSKNLKAESFFRSKGFEYYNHRMKKAL